MCVAVLKPSSRTHRSRKPVLTKTLTFLIAFCLSILAATAYAQSADARSNARMLQLQMRVDELYERAEFERAFLIYRDELASLGDKYAQYMVGYMVLTGQGARQDPIQASAWYRLAAERGTKEFEMVRDDLLSDFDAAEMQRSNDAYHALCRRYCDAAILLSAIRHDLDKLSEATGSRLAAGGSPMTIIDRTTGRSISGAEYYGRIRQQLGMRLSAIVKMTGATNLSTDPDEVKIDEIEKVVEEYLREPP